MSDLTVKVGSDTTQLHTGLEKARKGVAQFGKALVAAFAAGKVIGAVGNLADELDRIGKLSSQLGIAPEQLQRIGIAAELSGAGLERVTTAFSRMQGYLQRAQLPKEFADGLSLIGLEADKLKSLQPEELFKEIGTALEGLTSQQRVGIVTALFGESGKELLPFLEEAKKGLGDFEVASNENVRAAENLNDAMTILNASFKAQGSGVLPFLVRALIEAQSAVGLLVNSFKGMQAIMEAIGRIVSPIAVAIGDVLTRSFMQLVDVLSAVGEAFQGNFGKAKDILKETATATKDTIMALGELPEQLENSFKSASGGLKSNLKELKKEQDKILKTRQLAIDALNKPVDEGGSGVDKAKSEEFARRQKEAQNAAEQDKLNKERDKLLDKELSVLEKKKELEEKLLEEAKKRASIQSLSFASTGLGAEGGGRNIGINPNDIKDTNKTQRDIKKEIEETNEKLDEIRQAIIENPSGGGVLK